MPDARHATPLRPLPRSTPETAHFWEGTAAGELRLQRCATCSVTYFPPSPLCPGCTGDDVAMVTAIGTGRLVSYVVSHLAAPGFEPPYVIAVVELDEGPRMLTNLVGVDPDPASIPLDMALEVVFETVGEVTLPLFRPRVAP